MERITVEQEYLALTVGQSIQLTANVSPAALSDRIRWSMENGDNTVASVDRNGQVTAVGIGTAYAVASITDGKSTYTARCRIDVADVIRLDGVQLGTDKLTAELYSRDYTRFKILLQLPQNCAVASASAEVPENKGVAIASAKFTNPELAKLFTLVPLDDRTVSVVPTDAALTDAKAVQSKYVSAVTVTVQGEAYTSETLTLTVKKTLPKLKATIPAFNNFWSGQTQEITVTGATVTGITCENLPDWLSLNGKFISLTENVSAKGGSAKLTLLVETEEWVVPVETALAVKCSYKAPGLKLNASSIQLAGADSGVVKLQLLSKDKKETLSDLGVDGISAPDGYSINNYNAEDGTFTIKAEEGFQPGKINLAVSFRDTAEEVFVPLTVKVTPVTLKPAPNSITLNSGTGDSAAVSVTATPADYRLTAPKIRLEDSKKQDKLESGELSLRFERGKLYVSTTDTTPDNAQYTLYISAAGGKEAALKIRTTNAEPALKLKTAGNLDISFPGQKVNVSTIFKNHSGGNLRAVDYKIVETSGKVTVDENAKVIGLTKEGNDLYLSIRDDSAINVRNTYTLHLTLTMADGSTLESSIKIPLKQTAVALKLSASKVTLNKTVADKAAVTVTCTTKGYDFKVPYLKLTDAKGNPSDGLDVFWNNGKVNVGVNDQTTFGASYKVLVSPAQGAKAVSMTVSIPAEAKSAITGTLKVSGNLDVVRDGTVLIVTPTWKNFAEAERKETLTVLNSSGEDITQMFHVAAENGIYRLTRAADAMLDHNGKYTVKLTADFGNGIAAEAKAVLKLKMRS